jgi:uncharacterized protein
MLKTLENFLLPLTFGGIALAYSGGTDSLLLLAVLAGMRRRQDFPLLALTFHSAFHTEAELDSARRDARALGIAPEVVEFAPLDDPQLRYNPPDRCYLCKRAIFTRSRELAGRRGMATLMDGTNADDLLEWRPGRRALAELGVVSPLAELGIGKAGIHALARDLGLPVHPSNSCLATRFLHDTPLLPSELRRVEQGEALLHGLGLKKVRLRWRDGAARVEVDAGDFETALRQRGTITEGLRRLGFGGVSLQVAPPKEESFSAGLENRQQKLPSLL